MDELKESPSRDEDMTGRDRLMWNTFVSWGSQLTVIVSGFVMPRLMHESLGQTTLGIWDFAWTFVNYFNLMSLGIGSSVNRFVARYRAARQWDALNTAVSTVAVIQFFIALVVLLLVFGVHQFVAVYYAERLGDELETAQSIVVVLGLCVAVEMLVNSARGVITGHHRWDIHNGLYAGSALMSLVLMAGVLLTGGDIVQVSLAYLATTVSTEALRLFLAFRIADGMNLSIGKFSARQGVDLFVFGVKTLLLAFPQVILVQTVNLVTAAFLGPAALAVFSRPFALVRHLYTLVYKFTMILTPTAGSLQALEDNREIREFFRSTTRFNFALAVPAVAFFVVLGDLIIEVWMGPEYRHWKLMIVLALGHLLAIGQDGIIRIMQGLNLHGRLAVYLSISAIATALVMYLSMAAGEWTLLSSAYLLTVTMTVSYGIVVPVYSCYALQTSLWEYISHSLIAPLVFNLPFITVLVVSRLLLENGSFAFAGLVFLIAILLEATIYFRILLPDALKRRVLGVLRIDTG